METCAERRRLADEVARATEAYAQTGKKLKASIAGDLTEVLSEIERAREKCSAARRALQVHMIKHGC